MSLDYDAVKEGIEKGNTSLGIELGSTRIKAVLIGEDHTPIASGSHDWETGMWTISGPIPWMTYGMVSGTVIRRWRPT